MYLEVFTCIYFPVDTGCWGGYYEGKMMVGYRSFDTPGRGVVRDPPVDLSDIESRENGVYRIGLVSFSSCILYLVSCILILPTLCNIS